MTSNQNHRRAHTRFNIKFALRYRAAGGPNREWKNGSTRDMSAGGMLIDVAEELTAGSKLEIAMDWTGLYHDREMVRLFVRAVVVRVDERGTALRILGHQFRAALPAVVQKRLAVVA